MPTPSAPAAGWVLGGRYRIADRIGAGGMAEVFRAHDELLSRDVAVKVFRSHADPDDSSAGAQRQEIELQALARLSHPNLITLFDGCITAPGEPAFLVMELINGPSLAARIAEAPLTEPQAREVASQISDALAYVHAQQMVHRDIKPANILLGTDATTADTSVRARLSDFGIVRLLGSDHLTSANFMVGTASYLAPEQARGAEVGPPADVYALGLVMIEALTGVRSFPGPAMEAVMARLHRRPDIPAELPTPWPDLLRAMTDADPARRPPAAEVAAHLRPGARTVELGAPAAAGLAGAGLAGAGLAGAALGAVSLAADGLADSGTAVLAAEVPAVHDVGPVDHPVASMPAPASARSRTGHTGWLVGAAVLLVALAASAFALLRPTGGTPSSPASPGSTPARVIAPAVSGATPISAPAGGSTGVAPTISPTASRTSAAATTTPPPSTAPATSTAPPTSTQPTGTGSPTSTGSATTTASGTATTTGTGTGTPAATPKATGTATTPTPASAAAAK